MSLLAAATPVIEIEMPSGDSAFESIDTLITRLSALAEGSVVSITGIEGIFPDPQKRLETLVALSFQRERLAALALKQIWWIPSHLSEQFILGIPDLDSWFQLRLHLTEVPRGPQDQFESLDTRPTELADADGARALAKRFWEGPGSRLSAAFRLCRFGAIWASLLTWPWRRPA